MDITTFIQDNTVLRPQQIQAKAKIFDAWAKYDEKQMQGFEFTDDTRRNLSLTSCQPSISRAWTKQIVVSILKDSEVAYSWGISNIRIMSNSVAFSVDGMKYKGDVVIEAIFRKKCYV